jgi:AAA15 family ATPase/GTPase
MLHIKSIQYKNYKSFKQFSITLTDFNILVGPNNAGKSTIIGSIKILSEGIRKARTRKPIWIKSPASHDILGYEIDLNQVPIATENIFHNYDDEDPALIKYNLSDGSSIQIYFPEIGICYMNVESELYIIRSPADFKTKIPIEIGFVPILGPVDHNEKLYQMEAARLALLTYTASRNFRNIWYHYGEDFNEFRELIKTTWPGMDIDRPEVVSTDEGPRLNMFCPEDRIPREIFWAGFGFQVWCQMLTYIVKNKTASVFLIDEPDIYLHSDLQRQLLGILKSLGPDIILATHSTELISEAELNDILVVNKSNQSAKRIKDPSELKDIFHVLGSNLNPILTQIAKSKRVLFVEGKDFLLFSKIARILKKDHVANRTDFAVIPVEGFNPVRLKAVKEGIEKTIGAEILSGVIFDRDYRSDDEVRSELKELLKCNHYAHIHSCKEIENFLLIPEILEKAIHERVGEHNSRTNLDKVFRHDIIDYLNKLLESFKHRTNAQIQAHQINYSKKNNFGTDLSVPLEKVSIQFDSKWETLESRLKIVPGKEFLATLNNQLQEELGISISLNHIINSMKKTSIPYELVKIIENIDEFRRHRF